MGGFTFGSINDLDPLVSLISFLGVVLFLIFFDYVTGVIEFLLERSPLYNRMLQLIYKELMLMGLVSFAVIMYASTNQSASDHHSLYYKVIVAIDFAHILLFYVTLFFVLNAFYLMALSIFNEKKYHQLAAVEVKAILHKIDLYSNQYPWWNYLFESEYWPFSSVKDHIEFHLLKDLFEKTYLLSLNFDFPAYISLSFGRFALKTINRSLFTWIVFLIGIVLNFCRIVGGFSCSHSNHKYDGLTKQEMNCDNYTVRLFLASGVILSLFFFLLMSVSYYYKRRLLSFGAIKKPTEYRGYLKEKEKERLANVMTEELQDLERYHNRELKHEIEHEFHSNENAEESEEEPEIAFLATTLLKIVKVTGETISKLRMKMRLFIAQTFFGTARSAPNTNQSLLTMSTKKEREKVRRDSDFSLHAVHGNPHSSTQSAIKKAEHIPLKKKLSVRFIHHHRQSVLIVRQHQEEFPELLNGTDNKPPEANEEKTSETGNSPDKKATSAVVREAEGTKDNTTETAVEKSSPAKRVSFAMLAPLSLNKVIPDPTPVEAPTPTSQLRGKLNDLKNAYRSQETDINSIFFFKNPRLYFKFIEIALMFSCLYTAIWATNMVTLVYYAEYSDNWSHTVHFFMIIPIIWCLYCLAHVAEAASMLSAMTELNLSVVHDVLVQMEVTEQIVNELRQRFREILDQNARSTSHDEFVNNIFNEIDEDGSGFIDRDEFRGLLRKLQITFSNYRFKLLYRVIDAANDGLISREDFKAFILPDDGIVTGTSPNTRPRFTSEDIGNERLAFQRQRSRTIDELQGNSSPRHAQRKQLSSVVEVQGDADESGRNNVRSFKDSTKKENEGEAMYELVNEANTTSTKRLRLESVNSEEETNNIGFAFETDEPLAARIDI